MRNVLVFFVGIWAFLGTAFPCAAAQRSWTGNTELDAAFVLNNQGRYQEAFAAFSSLHERGVAMAGTMLGRYYEEGRYVARDTSKAVAFFTEAVHRGDVLARYHYGRVSSANWEFLIGEEGRSLIAEMERAAQRGNVPVQAALGSAYMVSAQLGYAPDVSQGYTKGMEWTRKAAEADYAPPNTRCTFLAAAARLDGWTGRQTTAIRWP